MLVCDSNLRYSDHWRSCELGHSTPEGEHEIASLQITWRGSGGSEKESRGSALINTKSSIKGGEFEQVIDCQVLMKDLFPTPIYLLYTVIIFLTRKLQYTGTLKRTESW
jgi:hypothetical protein